jgi:tubulin polyglutamylase TTLL4
MQIGRKDNMWRNIFRLKRKHGKDYDICPKTYIFPEDTKRFKQDRESEKKKNVLYILKPAALSCGRGIKIIGKNTNIGKRKGYVASRYLHKPHLINGYKYDLRVYILVSSFDPLRVYMYDEGLVRFATEKYSTKKSALKKRFVHLTNYSVNKKSSTYKPNNLKEDNAEEDSNR